MVPRPFFWRIFAWVCRLEAEQYRCEEVATQHVVGRRVGVGLFAVVTIAQQQVFVSFVTTPLASNSGVLGRVSNRLFTPTVNVTDSRKSYDSVRSIRS